VKRAFTLDLEGLSETIASLKKKGKDIEADVQDSLQEAAINIERSAASVVVKDKGAAGLSGAINAFQETKNSWAVEANKNYAAYVEFGTGRLVKIPKGLESYAAQFKGRGVREVNLPARPFLFPAFETGKKWLINEIKNILKKAK
jgi:HK97 gp10 family phage protein